MSSYQDASFRSLAKPAADVNELRSLFLDPSVGRFDSVECLVDAGWADAMTAVVSLFTRANVDDLVLVFFGGHGVRNKQGDLYFAFSDTDSSKVEGTSLPAHLIARAMDTSSAASQLLILDCCFSGAFSSGVTRSADQINPVEENYQRQVLSSPFGVKAVLTASNAIEYAYEDGLWEVSSQSPSTEGSRFSVFSEALISGLRGAADGDNDGVVGLNELFEYVLPVVRSSGRPQTPQLLTRAGVSRGDLAIAQSPNELSHRPIVNTFLDALLLLEAKDRVTRIEELANGNIELGDIRVSGSEIKYALRELVFKDPNRNQRQYCWDSLRQKNPVHRSNDRPPQKRAEDLLPGPFEWCKIPQGLHHSRALGSFDIRSFEMAKYPVTYEQFQTFIEARNGYKNSEWWVGLTRPPKPYEQWAPIAAVPRVRVTWFECVAFTRWLSAEIDRAVRLPLEWEWEWAASAGNADATYPWGDRWNSRLTNVKDSGIGQISPVDNYPSGASEFGVMGMAGNVWERCLNLYKDVSRISYSGNQLRVIRGGSYLYPNWKARIDHRHACIPDRRFSDGGFRLVVSAF